MDASLVLSWSLYSTLLKKSKLELSQFSLIQTMVTVGLIFLFPQFLYEQSVGLDVKINIAFISILIYVVVFLQSQRIVGKKQLNS